MAYIYQITNDVNGKIYIGKTERSIEERFKEHYRDRKRYPDRPLYRAINKYGIEHFHIILLEETDQPEERETYWIERKQSYKYGYNATIGGDGKKYLDYDLICSVYNEVENAKEVSRILGISTDSVYTAVRQQRELKSSQEISRIKNSKVVHMYKNGELINSFSSLKEAGLYLQSNKITLAKDTKGIATHIRECANGKRNSAYGYTWKWSD